MKPRRIAFLAFDGVNALDLTGPSEVFASALVESGGATRPGYAISILGLKGREVRSESGVLLKPHQSLSARLDIDTLIVPGGRGLRVPSVNARVAKWIRERAPKIRRIASVCTGIYGLAATGLLEGRRVTTHWRFVRDVTEKFPGLRMEPNALHVRDGSFYTSAGVTAGIDLALALVEEDYGPEVALRAARELVVYLKRSGGQEQYSEPLRFQVEATEPIAALGAWIRSHLRHDLSVEALARRASLCPRQFSRRFQRAFRQTPAAFVEDLRLGEARERLAASTTPIESLAASVGFSNPDSFRRAFERRYGLPPTAYRKRFAARGPEAST
ncbi:MAG: GlxA family transcriptional regulator [Vicinamibacteria bacterium]|nr:GlxA family transcriptional regulator [Vicinamibacteria bacterium]